MTDKAIDYNKSQCSPNKLLEFRGAVAVPLKHRFNNEDYTALDLLFSEKIHMRFFDPKRSVIERVRQSTIFQSLCKCVGTDFLDIPPCPGGWEDFVVELTSLLAAHKYVILYAKITIDADGRIIPGTGECFSLEPNMTYSDEDLRFLDSEETYKIENTVDTEDLPSFSFNRENIEEAEVFAWEALPAPVEEPKRRGRPKKNVEKAERAFVDNAQKEVELGLGVFEEYLAKHDNKPKWVEEEAKAHKKRVGTPNRRKKMEPLTLKMKTPNLDEIEWDDLPTYSDLPF